MKYSNRTFTKYIIDFFHQKGIKYVCIAPGSRNTPLTEAFINHKKIKCFSHIDERSLCYYAIGLAKASSTTVAVLTTSGTATANLFPGIVESKLSKTPLLILTADRPSSLINTGEPQTINQNNLYGEYVNEMLDVDFKNKNLNTLINKISKKMSKSIQDSAPIHINFRFDEPLFDTIDKVPKLKLNNNIPLKSKAVTLPIINLLPEFKRPLIICGPMSPNSEKKYILLFAKKINAPIFADVLSQMRNKKNKKIFVYYENYLKKIEEKPDIVFRFGDKPISKNLNIFLNKTPTFLISEKDINNDNCKNKIILEYKNLLTHISTDCVGEKPWIKSFRLLEKNVSEIITTKIKGNNHATLIISTLKKIKKGDHILIGNSTTIRMFERFSGNFNKNINVYGNYITRGIDGLVSTALGMSTINKKFNNYLFIGDLSFFYDINAFHILKNEKINLTIIVANNNGGQIFSQLPYANNNIKHFEKYWITPPFTEIKNVARLFKLRYYKFDVDMIEKNLHRISKYKGVTIIEIKINTNKDKKLLTLFNQISK